MKELLVRSSLIPLLAAMLLSDMTSYAQQDRISIRRQGPLLVVFQADMPVLSTPAEGVWSIAKAWEDNWPAGWKHASIDSSYRSGEWMIHTGGMRFPEGEWQFTDSYRPERDRIKCVRRFEWKGKQTLEKATLSVRWQLNVVDVKPLQPGINYHGNPSGERNRPESVAWYHGKPGDIAVFEEHRYPMPFTSVEWADGKGYSGAALHSIPSAVKGGNHFDQWWSLGLQTLENKTELMLLSGPVAYNGKKSVAKALQQGPLPYGDTYTKIRPGTVIEKTYYLQAYPVGRKGSGFEVPLRTSLDIFRPYALEDLPTTKDIIDAKLRFARSRWVEGEGYAGFNMYPSRMKPQIVMGWCGQAESLGYALQVLAAEAGDVGLLAKAQASLDHLSSSPVGANGFPVIYDIGTKHWSRPDPVSEGQAMQSIALAIRTARKQKTADPGKWETFLRRSADIHSARILTENWKPVNTAEAFYISPLVIAADLFRVPRYREAARKAADHYAKRHIDMDEPYWGGTLDATCEDKEGAWAAFQGFLEMYESTKEAKYLDYARHAGLVTLSYTTVWDIPMPAGRLADHNFRSRGWTMVSAQNQHLDVFGVVFTPALYKLGQYTEDSSLIRLAQVMFRSCGQLTDPQGSQGEQIQHTNFAQHGDMSDVYQLRGGYSEGWTVFWITAHFLHAAAQFREMGVRF